MSNLPVITKDADGTTTISVLCNAGTLHADIETRDRTPYNSIYIRFTPMGKEDSIDIACVRDIDNSHDLDVKLWLDPLTENPVIDAIIHSKNIKEAMLD